MIELTEINFFAVWVEGGGGWSERWPGRYSGRDKMTNRPKCGAVAKRDATINERESNP